MLPLKIEGWNTRFLLGPGIFSGAKLCWFQGGYVPELLDEQLQSNAFLPKSTPTNMVFCVQEASQDKIQIPRVTLEVKQRLHQIRMVRIYINHKSRCVKMIYYYPPCVKNGPFEDVFPIDNGNIPFLYAGLSTLTKTILGGGNSNILYFTPLPGKMIQF